MRYTVVLIPDRRAGGYVAYVPAIPGCVTQGESIEQALAMAKDAATALTADMADLGEDVPAEPFGAVVAAIDVAPSRDSAAVA